MNEIKCRQRNMDFLKARQKLTEKLSKAVPVLHRVPAEAPCEEVREFLKKLGEFERKSREKVLVVKRAKKTGF